MFEVEYSSQARKFLKKAEKILAERLIKKIEELRLNPVIHDSKTVKGFKEQMFRVRVGDYRILYEVDYSSNKIGIVKIDYRSKVFNKL